MSTETVGALSPCPAGERLGQQRGGTCVPRGRVGRRALRGGRVGSFTTRDDAARDLITGADTCFVASFARGEDASGRHGVDVSHRGGRPGFIGIDGDGALVVPDYAGNGFFNTLGNLMVN